MFSAVGLLHIGDVFTLMLRVVVILLLKESAFGGLPLFFFAEGVALIDDVVTTAATVGEVTLMLNEKGVERVDVWCLARAEAQRRG